MTLTAHQNAQLRLDFAATMAFFKLPDDVARIAWESAQCNKGYKCYRAIANSIANERENGRCF